MEVELQIENSELYIYVKKENNKYIYSMKEGKEEKEYLDTLKERPIDIKPRSGPTRAIIDAIENHIPRTIYNKRNINVYFKQQMQKLEKKLKIQEDNQTQEYKYDYTAFPVKGYSVIDDIYCKIDYRNGEQIVEYEVLKGEINSFQRISDYSTDTTNKFEISILAAPNGDGKREKYTFEGDKDTIVKKILNNELAWQEHHIKDFIYKLAYTYSSDNTIKGVVGGYASWDNIEKIDEKEKRDLTELLNYFKNILTHKHLEVIKGLMLIPFHWILRQDKNYMGRNIIKFVIIHGAPSAFKNGIVNIVRNMFDFHTTIPIDAGGTPNTYASLRNAINDNIGFVLCDESNNVFIDENKKFRNQEHNSVENLLKGIFQAEMPIVSSEKIGKNKDQDFRGTPIFIWNDEFKKTQALKDRCFVFNFEEKFNTEYENLFDVNYFKKDLLYFGRVFSCAIKFHWENDLEKIRDYEELINKVFQYMIEDYNIDVQFLIDTEIKEEKSFVDILSIFFSRMSSKIYSIYNFDDYFLSDNVVNPELFKVLSGDVKFIKAVGKTPNNNVLYIHKDHFITYIRDKVANDGGLQREQIEKLFHLEKKIDKNGKEKYFNVSGVECYKMRISFILENITKLVEEEEIDKKNEIQGRIL